MVTESKVKLAKQEREAIEHQIDAKGYHVYDEYYYTPRAVETDISCPICSKMLVYIQTGASYSIKCRTENCVDVGVRGI